MNDPSHKPEPLAMPGGTMALGDRMATFRRIYRWANLTILQQGLWPLLVLMTAAAPSAVEWTPFPWYWARLAAPVLAALMACLYLRQPVPEGALVHHVDDPAEFIQNVVVAAPPDSFLARQARVFLIGMPVMLAIVILVTEPLEPAARVLAFGLAQVAAYHLIHFGVVPRSYANHTRGLAVGTLLFAVSWGIFNLLSVAVGTENVSLFLAFLSGVVIGGVVAVVSRLLMRWPGGRLTAPAVHWLVIYLIFGVLV